MHFTPVHILRQLERDKGLFPPLPLSLADQNGLENLPRQIFSAFVKVGGNLCRDVETLGFHNCSDLFKPVHTCSHLSDDVRSSRNISFSLNFPLLKAVNYQFYILSC